ncbi:unnamed protein product [Musa acuminata subsp. malaccensis]|uniref:(wild Malaysian banana) hypothetical protein n=1 Tax=Musa acuminata subsp. malaccensis TaxID=214687 RepID=A0A804IMX4_MUSAM|nr:PREDICTED: uncharacterized protein LOC103981033 isoform X1 [Musa acuminata subsp. malaccensis]XP_018680875.1 PREDICTED: uncharacterized protein LOC103981033 isoform X1 [Musa acuminata subsp. malaccensis]XP_018680876.1 PREDICTED: uncharacterized protein LOC103981033 isoform X1 [Musa acuminata subsp. malaccensis]CAG1841691.1 unnamed protein product [Musa acuminata subsp. malaccensis]
MILRYIPSLFDPQTALLPLNRLSPLRRNPRVREALLQTRRRRRRRSKLSVRSALDDLVRNLVSAFPSPASLDLLLTPAIGLAAGAALYLSSLQKGTTDVDTVVGEWVIFTSPTPFNRSVLLRCPSVSFEDGGELLGDGVNEKLLTEERHYMNLDRGRMTVARKKGEEGPEKKMQYQRVCVATDDGGVISLDWPVNLELGMEHGLDTTVLIIPGTTEGSMDRNVRAFVFDVLQHGCFPIVMNPRGCASSPVTTPRLFTAADSDDVSTAVRFVSMARPWTTVMSVGWGYGANMLTKYLSEVGESTVLTAAVCIDNPFDLTEVTRSFPHHVSLDQKIRSGLIDILRANKELFQGKAKGFDVGRALSAKSVREFDGAISMVSHGYHTIEDFYSKISTRKLIGNLKIPVLFVQSDDGTVPTFSIPRGSIAENPFTSLLLSYYLPSTGITTKNSAILWCQRLAIEWISAVEFALLKGRHPLLKDVDVAINPSKGLAFIDDRTPEKSISSGVKGSHNSSGMYISHKSADRQTYGKLSQPSPVNGFLNDSVDIALKQNYAAVQGEADDNLDARSKLQQIKSADNEGTKNSRSIMDFKNESAANAINEGDDDGNKVLQTAAVVMNMLDITMPSALDDEQKKKVLSAVGRGENLLRALQGAVPEDVRGKLTSAVTEILQTQGTKLNLEGLNRIDWIPNVTSKVKSRIQDSIQEISIVNRGDNESNSGVDHEEKVQSDTAEFNSARNRMPESIKTSEQRTSQSPGMLEAGYEPSQDINLERSGYMVDETAAEQQKISQNQGISDRHNEDDKDLNNPCQVHNGEGKKSSHTEEQLVSISVSNTEEESLSSGMSASDHQIMPQESNELQKNEDKSPQDLRQNLHNSTKLNENSPQHSSSETPSISVTQALDALTGFDDSTQLAVNSVFGVLENMIDQLEKNSNEGDDDEMKRSKDEESQTLSPGLPTVNKDNYGRVEHRNNKSSEGSDVSLSSKHLDSHINQKDTQSKEVVENKLGENLVADILKSSAEDSIGKSEVSTLGFNSLKNNSVGKFGPVQNCPSHIAIKPYYWGSPFEAYLQKYLYSKFPRLKPSDLDSTTDLFLDPEKGQWKMLDQAGTFHNNLGEGLENQNISGYNESQHNSVKHSDTGNSIETSYVILNSEFPEFEQQLTGICDMKGGYNAKEEAAFCLVRDSLLDALKVEVGRRLSTSNLKEMERVLVDDMKQVADAIIQAVVLDNHLNLRLLTEVNHLTLVKFGTIEGERTVKIISSAVEETSQLKKILPVGVIVGSLLASLRKHFKIAASRDGDQIKDIEQAGNVQETLSVKDVNTKNELHDDEKVHAHDDSVSGNQNLAKVSYNDDGVMIGAVTAALGATALLAHHQQRDTYSNGQAMEVPSRETIEKGSQNEEHDRPEVATHEKIPTNIMCNLAEKAMSIAGPVVPMKDDGEVDQERLVTVLAELGQKGGLLRLVGKIALLWGGIRGAMSLTDRLISFLRISERPLLQRVIWFGCMTLVLWSPVVVPLLPMLVQSWTTRTSNKFAEYACVLGLYASSMILVVLWGKRIRGYDNPLEQYGLDFTAPRALGFMKGLVGGMAIVMSVHSINGLLGYASLACPSFSPLFRADPVLLLKSFVNMLLKGVRGIITAAGIALAEELLFRSWLLEEVAVDLGYYRAIVISGIAFSLIHGSLPSVPGFLLLSLALFGIKQRSQDKIYVPIGIRSGIMFTNFTLQTGGLIRYKLGTPPWLISTHPLHPFDGVVGLGVCVLLTILFFPKQPQQKICSKDNQQQNG